MIQLFNVLKKGKNMGKNYEVISHTADMQIRAYGKSKEELFRNALIGMFQSIKPISDECLYSNEKLLCQNLPINHRIRIESSELELLLVDFLSECLYLSDINNEAYLDIEIHQMTDNSLDVTLKGIKIKGFEVVEIKAVTYNDLSIKYQDGLYIANVVFDI